MRYRVLRIFIGLCVLMFSGCGFGGGDDDISSLSYLVTDSSSVPENLYSETSINIIPDYELRTLSISFVVSYPYRTEETEFFDIDTEAIVGGDYFNNFEKLSNNLKEETLNDEVNEDKENQGLKKYSITLLPIDEEAPVRRFIFYEGDELEVFEEVESFFDEVVALFSEDVF